MKMIPIDRAISSANTIRTFNPAAVLFLLAALINPYLEWADSPIRFDYYFTYLCIAAAFVVGKWFWTHGRLQSQDPEYQLAKKTMRKSLILWLAVNIVNLGILIISRNLIR